jgi:crossover junction endonuclease EME1
MPPEIISLLSSSPPRPASISANASFELANQNNKNVLYRAPGCDTSKATAAESRKHATKYLPGTKRASTSYQPRHDDNDFLFLTDDFDTTGDLEYKSAKKPRVSPSPLRHGKKTDSSLLTRTQLAVVERSSREPLQPIVTNRLSFLAEDIEFSSSPVHSSRVETRKRAPRDSYDPFSSSQEKQMGVSTSHDPVSKHAATSSLESRPRNGDQGTWEWPAGLHTTQSPKENTEARKSGTSAFIDLSSDPIQSPPPRPTQKTPSNSHLKAAWDPISSSAHDICDLLSSPPAHKGPKQRQTSPINTIDESESDDLTDLENVDFSKVGTLSRSRSSASQQKPPKGQGAKKAALSAEERARERKQKAEAKEAEKERKRIEKERAKEERTVQKEKEKALAEVNKLRTDKKVSTPEMIVDIPASIHPGLKVQIEALLGDLDVQHQTWNSTVEHVVKWRRKVTSRFNEEMGFWEPTPLHIKDEDHVMVVLQAAEFVRFILGGEGQDLEAHVLQMKTKFPNMKLIYLIEGLTPWMRKNRNLLNRQFASAVRSLAVNTEQGSSSGQPRRRGNAQNQEYVDEDKVEDGLLSLQVSHGTLVHHTNAPVETAQWVAVFTQHISTIPYRKARDASADAGFCMDAGQVRTGEGAKDTYIRMLQEITRVTAPIAYGIAAKYESVSELIRGLEEGGPLALAECRKSANKDGALTDRTIGQAISRRIHKIFLGRDPTSTDI